MTLEPHLRRALAEVDPDDGFADRVVDRIGRENRRQASSSAARGPGNRPWSRAGMALAASLLAAVAGSAGWLEHERRVEGERARARLIEALRVTSASLETVGQKVARHTRAGGAGL